MKLESIDVRTLAAIIGLTPRQIQRLVKEGVLPKVGRGRYDLAACVQAWGAHLVQGKVPEGLSTERRRLVAAQAQRAEMENKRMASELLAREAVEVTLAEASVTFVRGLEALPGRLAGVLSASSSAAEIRQATHREIRELRVELAKRFDVLATMGHDEPPWNPATRRKKPANTRPKSRKRE